MDGGSACDEPFLRLKNYGQLQKHVIIKQNNRIIRKKKDTINHIYHTALKQQAEKGRITKAPRCSGKTLVLSPSASRSLYVFHTQQKLENIPPPEQTTTTNIKQTTVFK